MPKNKELLIAASVAIYFIAIAPYPAAAASKAHESKKANGEATSNSGKAGISGSYLASRFSRSTGDIISATKSLEEVYSKNPKDSDIGNQLMGLYLLSGKVEKAISVAEKFAKDDNKAPVPTLLLSLQAIKNGNIPQAEKILEAVEEDDGGQLWLPLISAWLDADQHKLKKPIIMEELSAEVGNAAPIVSYQLALINWKAGFIDAAADDLKQAVSYYEGNPPKRVMQLVSMFYEANNKPEKLKQLLASYTAENTILPTGKPIDFADAQPTLPDGVAEVLYSFGAIMLAGDVAQDATLYLQLALYIKPEMEIANLTLAEAYKDLGQFGIVSELLAKIPATSPLYETAQLYSAVNLAALKKYAEATKILDTLIAKNPKNIDNYIAKGDLLRVQDKFAQAAETYKAAIFATGEKQPQSWALFYALATCYDKLANWEGTEENLKQSLDLSPGQPDVLNYFGYSLLMRGERLQEARAMIEKAAEKRPDDPQIMDSMGWALYLLGDYQNASVYLEGAVALLPNDATVNEHLGDLYWRLGRKTEARFQWERTLTYNKDEATMQQLRKKLKEGLPETAKGDSHSIPANATSTPASDIITPRNVDTNPEVSGNS